MIDDGQNEFEDPKPVTAKGNDYSWLL